MPRHLRVEFQIHVSKAMPRLPMSEAASVSLIPRNACMCVCVWVHACVLACEGRIVCAASNIGHEEGRDWLIDCALFWTMPPRWFLWAKHSHRHCAFLSGISSSLPIAAAAAPSSLSFLLVTCMRPLWLLLLLPLCPTPLPYPSASTLLLFVLDRSRIIPLSASLSIVYSTP